MKILLDEVFDFDLKKYLLKQNGINNVDIIAKDFISELNVVFNNKISCLEVLKYIESFQNNDYPTILAFDKDVDYEVNKLKYLVDDMCCEYCYKGLIYELFENENIKSVESNFDFYEPAFNIQLSIEYNKNYSKEELKNYIRERI